MAGFFDSLINNYREQVERHRQRPLLEASMAACALTAMADGNVSFPERVRVDQILETLDALRVFDPHEGVNLFNEFTEDIRENSRKGHERAVKVVQSVADDPEIAELIIRISLAINEADGEVSLVDQIATVTLCSLLGVDPEQFNLYRPGTID